MMDEIRAEPLLSKTPSTDRTLHPSRILIVISLVLPAVLFGLAAWENRAEVTREAETRITKTVGILNEHAVKVFETHVLAMDLVKERLRMIDWSSEADRAALHQVLKTLEKSLDQIAAITITDPNGVMLASSRMYPADPAINFADRDWYAALKERSRERPFVSQSYVGRQSGQSVFNLADRVPSADASFRGAIAISVDRSYFERFYKTIEPERSRSIFLIRGDGAILARDPPTDQRLLSSDAPLMQAMKLPTDSGLYESVSAIDGIARTIGYTKATAYPVYVGFGLSREAALAPWWRNLRAYAITGFLSALALLVVSGLAIREAKRERLATRRWQEATEQLRLEAEHRHTAEGQLRQLQKMEAIGQLTGGIAHDFNNMLAVIVGSLSLAQKRLSAGNTQVQRFIDNAIEGAARATTLTSRLMAFSRQQPLAPQPVNASRLVGGMTELIRRTLGETVQLEAVLGAGLWLTHADPGQLESTLVNLCVNARDAMPSGGKLTIETGNGQLDDAYALQHDAVAGQYVLIAVTDTGTGMSAEVAAKAFDPFFTTKEVGKGTGLGLSQVHGFVKQSGGHLKIYSEPGHGTTVKIYLPRFYGSASDRDSANAKEWAVADLRYGDPGQIILVVEDEARVRESTVSTLRELNYTVIHAESAEKALLQLAAHPGTSLLFTDIVMPGANGRELADKAVQSYPNLKVLFTTGFTRNAIVHHGVLDAQVQFIAKPFTIEQLSNKVHDVLQSGETALAQQNAHASQQKKT